MGGVRFTDTAPYGDDEAARWADQDGRSNGQGRNGSNGDGPGERRLLFTPASKIIPRPITWVWDTTPPDATPDQQQGRFPAGSLVLAVGRAGLGKSQFAIWLTAQLTNGTLPGCYYRVPRSVVYCAAEDSWEMTIVPRLLAAGADCDRVFHVRVVDDGDPHARLTLPADTSCLEAGLGAHEVVLVVFDPLLSMLDAALNDYRAREVRHALEPLVGVADRSRCLFLGLAHFTKAIGSDPLLLVSGSGAFGQLIRAGVGFARDEDPSDQDAASAAASGATPGSAASGTGGSFVLSQIKNNLGREELPSLRYVIEPKAVETPEGLSWVSRFHFTGEESQSPQRCATTPATHADPWSPSGSPSGSLLDEPDITRERRSAGVRPRVHRGAAADWLRTRGDCYPRHQAPLLASPSAARRSWVSGCGSGGWVTNQPRSTIADPVDPVDELAEGGDLLAKRLAAARGGPDPRPLAAPFAPALHGDQARRLERLQVPAQVPVGEAERGLQVAEVDLRHPDAGGEDAESDALVHRVVEPVDRVGGHVSSAVDSAATPTSRPLTASCAATRPSPDASVARTAVDGSITMVAATSARLCPHQPSTW